MPVKIRLQRHGKKGAAFYHIVIADGRAPRNGKFIEKIGTYNPNTNPASIELNQDKALTWLKNGAQPTDTTRAILSYKGILYKLHLDKGVDKGALTAEQADTKLAKWLEEKDAKILGKISNLKDGRIDLHKKRIQDEIAKNASRAAAIAVKNTPVAAVVEDDLAAPGEVLQLLDDFCRASLGSAGSIGRIADLRDHVAGANPAAIERARLVGIDHLQRVPFNGQLHAPAG